MILSLLVACAQPEDSGVDLGEPAAELVLPDVSAVDFATAATDALRLLRSVSMQPAWTAHAELLQRRSATCPDLWVGAPDDPSVELDVEGGTAWLDHCRSGATDFDGWAWVEASATAAGEIESAEGRSFDGARTLAADGVIAEGAEVLLELDGEFSDSTSHTVGEGYERWTYSAELRGTITGVGSESDSGSLAETLAPGGFRTELRAYATGGDASELELEGNLFLFADRIAGRFDSLAADLAFAGPGAAEPGACELEPAGWLGLRDEEAYWYDISFQPRHGGGDAACDGCGELYVRGVDSGLGTVCVDASAVFSDTPVTPPGAEAYVFSLRTLEAP
jgi:hypothetical protein